MKTDELAGTVPPVRPSVLNPLFAQIETLPGLGVKSALPLYRLFGPAPHVLDVLFHLPSGIVDRRLRPKIADAMAWVDAPGR